MEVEPERELGMQQRHRQHIMRNIDKLIKCTNYNELVYETVRRGLITPDMRLRIEERSGDRYDMSEHDMLLDQHRRYFMKIMKRGPNAYTELKAILTALNHQEALHILDSVEDPREGSPYVSLRRNVAVANGHNNNNTNINSGNNGDSLSSNHSAKSSSTDIVDCTRDQTDPDAPLAPYTAPLPEDHTSRTVRLSDRIHTDSLLGTYKMQSRNRGVILIVNIINFPDVSDRRNGAEKDSHALVDIFRQMGFTIFSYTDIDQTQFFAKLRELIQSQYMRTTESFVLALMTHGERNYEMDKVKFGDGSYVDVVRILDLFKVDKCPNLARKPKVLIFPFCRGDKSDKGARVETDGINFNNKIGTLSDLLVCYATTPGSKTHRDPDTGTWYMQKFCDLIADHAHDTSVADIVTKTQAMVSNMRTTEGDLQTGAFENLGFNRKMYLNPGYYVD